MRAKATRSPAASAPECAGTTRRPQRPARRHAPAPSCAGTQSSLPMPRGLARSQVPGPPCRSPGAHLQGTERVRSRRSGAELTCNRHRHGRGAFIFTCTAEIFPPSLPDTACAARYEQQVVVQRQQRLVPTAGSMACLSDRKRRRACDGSSPFGLNGPVEPLPARFRGVLVASDRAGHKAVLDAGRQISRRQ
eukprot:scaffold4730_cov109-Isochrysis_galbana.AAC.11